jgi:hypothetical protein
MIGSQTNMIRQQRKFTLIFCLVLITAFSVAGCIDSSSLSPGMPQNISSVSESPTATIQETPVSPTDNSSQEIIIPERPDPQVLEQERQAIITFSGDTSLNPVFSHTINYSYGRVDFFDANNMIFAVNRDTDSIKLMDASNFNFTSGGKTISQDQGYSIAEKYARTKAAEIWNNPPGVVMTVRSTNETDRNNGLEYTWSQYYILPDNSSYSPLEIQGYNDVEVTLDPHDGSIISYLKWYLPLDSQLNLTPDLTEEQAWSYAKEFYESNGIEITDNVNKTVFGPSITTDENNNQHLTWKFYVDTAVNGIAEGGFVGIDAHDGSVVWKAMIA